ncbi:hypothetical protein FF011L_20110 [Roseimaritima multifibrata]|uniref:Prepilin-type N-terminal cleavage/methylation domain-containing protein n=1 Tax=Roseimaritima multifibrata TaxID=1930274 RepID=A0A517MED9_9BACT|nr:hypothetical protein [Roseimaritima multifibrata]QDS93249.1 hypothetical protein FF011L_20110 [Roseimaritima multifibrata]
MIRTHCQPNDRLQPRNGLNPARRSVSRGFTILETLLATAVLMIIAGIATQLLSWMSETQNQVQANMQQMHELNRLQQDLLQEITNAQECTTEGDLLLCKSEEYAIRYSIFPERIQKEKIVDDKTVAREGFVLPAEWTTNWQIKDDIVQFQWESQKQQPPSGHMDVVLPSADPTKWSP